MEHLAHRNIKALNDCIRKMYSDMEMQSLPNTIISTASEIIPSNIANMQGLIFNNKEIIITNIFSNAEFAAMDALSRHIHEHPQASLCFTGKMKPHPFRDDMKRKWLRKSMDITDETTKVSDFLTNSQWRSLALFNEFYRPNGIEYHLGIGMPLFFGKNFPLATGISFIRDKIDFSEKERLILNLLRPHIIQAFKNAEVIGALKGDKTGIGTMLMDGKAKDLNPETMRNIGITLREAEILNWISQGKTNMEISILLNISLNTVKTHLAHIYQKLGVENRVAAARVIMENNKSDG